VLSVVVPARALPLLQSSPRAAPSRAPAYRSAAQPDQLPRRWSRGDGHRIQQDRRRLRTPRRL